ncbi:GNAT family N-acetyltransferase [Nocardia sp. NRRL S-836]|uniref:GNAT family N-acetyltransferase n=1 Tax=Nocardia sp. NRRL S-836 TaxID=1519492 RepID=UPI0018D049CA|nr:GNAT family N-acetyltransferase [Nocardia sp. NRRL S-836]
MRRAGAPVFYEHAYLDAYEQAPLTNIDAFAYLVVKRGDETVAVTPAYLQTAADPLGCLYAAYPEARDQPALLSHTWHCYDAHVPSTLGVDVVPTVISGLLRVASLYRAQWCGFVNVRRGSELGQELRANGLPARHLVDRWTADLTGVTDYEHYLARLGERARANLRRTGRRSGEAGVTTEVLPVSAAALDEITALCGLTATRFDNNGFYPEGTFAKFVTALGGRVHVIEVRQRGRLVAAGVCLTDETRFHTWTCGVDYAVDGNYSPYAVLFAESVRLAIELGKPVLEGGRGNTVFKQRHGLTPRHLDAVLLRA